MAIGAMQEAADAGPARTRRPLDRRLRRDRRRRLWTKPAADDGRAADRRDRSDGGRGALGPGRATGRAAAELRLPAAPSPRRDDGCAVQQPRDVVEVVERLERALPSSRGTRPARPVRRHASRPCDAAVRVAVAHVRRTLEARDVSALARLAADGAHLGVAEDRHASRRDSGRAGSRDVEVEALSLEHGCDELVEAARDDERLVTARAPRTRVGATPSRAPIQPPRRAVRATLSNSTAMTSCNVRLRPSSSSTAWKISTSPNSVDRQVEAVHLRDRPVPVDNERLEHLGLIPPRRCAEPPTAAAGGTMRHNGDSPKGEPPSNAASSSHPPSHSWLHLRPPDRALRRLGATT